MGDLNQRGRRGRGRHWLQKTLTKNLRSNAYTNGPGIPEDLWIVRYKESENKTGPTLVEVDLSTNNKEKKIVQQISQVLTSWVRNSGILQSGQTATG